MMAAIRETCTSCGEPIGDHQANNVIYTCDLRGGEWCGGCFDRMPCGQGRHAEGCATMMICEARP